MQSDHTHTHTHTQKNCTVPQREESSSKSVRRSPFQQPYDFCIMHCTVMCVQMMNQEKLTDCLCLHSYCLKGVNWNLVHRHCCLSQDSHTCVSHDPKYWFICVTHIPLDHILPCASFKSWVHYSSTVLKCFTKNVFSFFLFVLLSAWSQTRASFQFLWQKWSPWMSWDHGVLRLCGKT